MPTPDTSRLERAFVPLVIFAVTAGIVSVVLDVWQDLSGVAAGVLPLAALGPAVGALAAWASHRRTLEGLWPAPVARRQVIAHLVLGVVASAVFLGLTLAVLALAGVALPVAEFGVEGVPAVVTIVGIIVAVALQELAIRGFAQPILELAGSRLLATIIIGLVWGFWVVQMFPMHDTALTVGAVVLAVTAFAVLLGHLGNGSVLQRVALTTVVHAIVAVAVALMAGAREITQPVALALLAASAITTIVFMAMFAAAQKKRARRATA